MALLLVPFNSAWITHDKLDLHAVYKRPRFVQDEFGEFAREVDKVTGEPSWDLTGALPVRQHNKWEAKGFKYITLANTDSLIDAVRSGTLLAPDGMSPTSDWQQYANGAARNPWNYKKYLEGTKGLEKAEADDLAADIAEFGWEAVEKIRRRKDPDFRIPERLKAKPAEPEAVVAKPAEERTPVKIGREKVGA